MVARAGARRRAAAAGRSACWSTASGRSAPASSARCVVHRRAWSSPGSSASTASRRSLLLGMLLGVAGASFAVALPLASRWYPPEHQGLALGIAGAGNSGTVLAALFAPGAGAWPSAGSNVLGLAAIPLAVALRRLPASSPRTRPATPAAQDAGRYLRGAARPATPGGSCSSTASPSAASSGLASSLTIYFNDRVRPDRRSPPATSPPPASSPARWSARSAARSPTASAASAR